MSLLDTSPDLTDGDNLVITVNRTTTTDSGRVVVRKAGRGHNENKEDRYSGKSGQFETLGVEGKDKALRCKLVFLSFLL